MFQADFWNKFLIPFNPLKMTKNRVFQVFFKLAHQNCLFFCSKVNLVNTYKLTIFICLGKYSSSRLIPLSPLKITQICQKCTFSLIFHFMLMMKLNDKKKVHLIWKDQSSDAILVSYVNWIKEINREQV